MILAAHQPAYLPWLGYFEKISKSDTFIFLDSVQFEKNSFTNRNLIKTAQGTQWLTVPVKTKDHLSSSLCQIKIDPTQKWKLKHLQAIRINYAKAPYFSKLFPLLEALYQVEFEYLADFCFHHLVFWLRYLGIEREILRSSQLSITSKKSQLILDLCLSLGANEYYSGKLGADYLDEDSFRRKKIEIQYQDFQGFQYPQLYGHFVPHLSILDFCMNMQANHNFFDKGEL